MKHHLRRTAGNACLTYEEVHTLLYQIETCLNSRPLVKLSEDPDDFTYLSPGHFLTGAPLMAIPQPNITTDLRSHTSRWRFIQTLQQSFWKQWSSDYLNSLQQRRKWQQTQAHLKPGTVVLVKDDNTSPLFWRLAVISRKPSLGKTGGSRQQ